MLVNEKIYQKWDNIFRNLGDRVDKNELFEICENISKLVTFGSKLDNIVIIQIMAKLYTQNNIKDYKKVYKNFNIWKRKIFKEKEIVETVHFDLDKYITDEFIKYYLNNDDKN